ncbi:MAG: hypothetical protein ACE5F9_13280 [Phycisphaerae bacterium]
MRKLGLFPIVILLSGCASTKMRSFVDPDFRGKVYERVLIAPMYTDLEQRETAEAKFVDAFEESVAECVPSMTIMLPTRKYTDDQLFSLLSDRSVDAVLFVRQTDYYEDVSSTTTTSGTLSANTFYYGQSANTYGTMQSTSRTRQTRKPRVRHELNLYDVDTRRMAWLGTSFTRGNAYARFKHLVQSLAEDAVDVLLHDGLILPVPSEGSP